MKKLEKIIKGRRTLVFVDLEGTERSHEMIEIGAYVALLRDDLTVAKTLPGYQSYVKARHEIGGVVERLTSIHQKTLDEEGIPFAEAEDRFRKYVGRRWADSLFVFFGSHDLRIIGQSIANNPEASKDIAKAVCRNAFDLSAFLAEYVTDLNDNPLSLANYLKTFGLDFDGKPHGALADARNLLALYEATLANPAILAAEYKKTLSRLHHLPTPAAKAIAALNEGREVTPADWDEFIAETFR